MIKNEQYHKIETPERIIFSYRIANLGTRFFAWIFDVLVMAVVLLLLALLLSSLEFSFFGKNDSFYAGYAFWLLVIFFFQWGYFIFWETLFSGRSLGKMIAKIRVVRDNGEPLDFQTIVLRNFLRSVDFLPGMLAPYLVGGIFSLRDKKARRLGDIVSGTLVVFVNKNATPPPLFGFPMKFSAQELAEYPVTPLVTRLPEESLLVIRRFFAEFDVLPPERRASLGRQLADKVKERIGYQREIENPLAFVTAVYKAHTYEDI